MGDQSLWDSLLSWLRDSHGMRIDEETLQVECRNALGAGKGLFATRSIPPNAALFTIPATAMINARTLSKIYPPVQGRTLTPVQIISLHLLLHRPPENGHSNDPTFGPFIDTMPTRFDSHPLVWVVAGELGIESKRYCQSLLASLPPSTSSSLRELTTGFWEDWDAVRNYMMSRPTSSKIPACTEALVGRFKSEDHFLKMDYVWAWLSVNTRCIYYRLDPSPSSSLNMTLCPILDFANHAPQDTHILPVLPPVSQPVVPNSGPGKRSKSLGGDYAFVSNCENTIPQDTELFLRYGAHANRKLFVEYGFVNMWNEGEVENGAFQGEVEVDDVVEVYFKNKGDLGDQMKAILEQEGYWGDWTLHSSPQPAHPSYRLVTALRLLHCTEREIQNEAQCWRDVLLGEKDIISSTNEERWRQSLLEICKVISSRATLNLEQLVQSCAAITSSPEWYAWAIENIQRLWLEELEVARCVTKSVEDGVDF